MKTKLLTILAVCTAITACAPDEQATPVKSDVTKAERHQIEKAKLEMVKEVEKAKEKYSGLILQGKVETINLNKLENNISLESNGTNETDVFSDVLENLDDFSTNMVMQAALNHNVLDGKAFSDNVALNLIFDNAAEKANLTPVVTPLVMMSENYDTIHISLHAATAYQNAGVKKQYESKYTTQKSIPNSTSTEKNKEYWVNNPLELKENIIDGLYEVSQQFANDFNTSEVK